MVKDPKFARFCLLSKIHKQLHDSNCGYHTENISSFLDFNLEPLTWNVEFYIKDTNDFLKKTLLFTKLTWLYYFVYCVIGLYPNIPHDECLCALCKRLDLEQEKDATTLMLVELADVIL